jgi:TonB family protein
MKLIFSLAIILLLSSFAYSQSGRRTKEPRVPAPPAQEPATEPQPTPEPRQDEAPPVTAERDQEYRCLDDGGLARILESNPAEPTVKKVDEQAIITSKPAPAYTKEARRNSIQGFVILKLLMTADSKIARIKVLKRLPAGLTESAIRAACKIKFKPAIKGGQPVARWVTAEYLFRLAESSIFTP